MNISGLIQGLDQGVRKTAAYSTGATFGAVGGVYRLIRGAVEGAKNGFKQGAQIGTDLGSITYRSFSAFSSASFALLFLNQTAMSAPLSLSFAVGVGVLNFKVIDDSLAKDVAMLSGAIFGALFKGTSQGLVEGKGGALRAFDSGFVIGEKSYKAFGYAGGKAGEFVDQIFDRLNDSLNRGIAPSTSSSLMQRKSFFYESLGRLISAGAAAYLIAPYALGFIVSVYNLNTEVDIF